MSMPKKGLLNISQKGKAISKRKALLAAKHFPSHSNIRTPPPIFITSSLPVSDIQSHDSTLNDSIDEPPLTSSAIPQNFVPVNVQQSCSSSSSSGGDDEVPLKEELAEWVIQFDVSRTGVTGLLQMLGRRAGQTLPSLPLGYQSLLGTPRNLQVIFNDEVK